MFDIENYEAIVQQIKRSEKRLLFFDYDGTLMPFKKLPSLSVPNEDLVRLLSVLTSDKKNNVVVISGRDSETLGKWLGNLNLIIVAEHGALIKYPGQKWKIFANENDDWKTTIFPAMEDFTRRCQGSFIEEKKFSLAWHYRNVTEERGNYFSRELIHTLLNITRNTSLQVLDGNKIIEVRFADVNKGVMVKKIVGEIAPDFVMAIGDDRTDEDMFKALGPDAVTIKIGQGATAASYTLPMQENVADFLKKIFLRNVT
jgi:trehalose 6-phosphate synthase/phosphatase